MLAKRYDVPVGLLYTPIGGSPMIAWIPESEAVKNAYLLRRSKEMASALKAWDNGGYQKAVAEHERKIADRKRKIAELKSRGKRIKSEPYRYYLPPNKDTPFGISSTPFFNFNAKVAPLSGYGVRGILWYQGESDTQGTSRQNFREQLEILGRGMARMFRGRRHSLYTGAAVLVREKLELAGDTRKTAGVFSRRKECVHRLHGGYRRQKRRPPAKQIGSCRENVQYGAFAGLRRLLRKGVFAGCRVVRF